MRSVRAVVWWAFVGTLGCATGPTPVQKSQASEVGSSAPDPSVGWDAFWRSRGVSPAPPRDFLEPQPPLPEILNLTNGAIDDETARRWSLAAVRRGMGDEWASCHLRLDVVEADVLGPPGLNGTREAILSEQAKGLIEKSCGSPSLVTISAAVVAISRETKARIPQAELTDFVIVETFRATGAPDVRRFADGRKESVPSHVRAGERSWQINTGEFREDATIGPLWYQARGWRCHAYGNTILDEICGLAQRESRLPREVQLPN
jgi:hypothetical protein